MAAMLHIGICDDAPRQVEYLSALVRDWAERREVPVRLSVFESAESFLFRYEEDKSLDILLLDIQMKAMDGVALAKILRRQNDHVQIVFITGHPDFMAEGYEVGALHYLMKPVEEDKLFRVLDRARQNAGRTEKSLLLNTGGQMERIPLSRIRYIEIRGHYADIHTITQTFTVKISLSALQDSLDEAFFRCQRSFIVNLKYLKKVTRVALVLDDLREIPLSRDLYEAACQAVIRYFP